MIVHFVGAPLAGLMLVTTDGPWLGKRVTAKGRAGWTLHVLVPRDPVTGAVMAEVREAGMPPVADRSGRCRIGCGTDRAVWVCGTGPGPRSTARPPGAGGSLAAGAGPRAQPFGAGAWTWPAPSVRSRGWSGWHGYRPTPNHSQHAGRTLPGESSEASSLFSYPVRQLRGPS